MEVLRIGSINVNGARDRVKRGLIAEYVLQKNLNVIFLQETHSDTGNEVDWGVWWKGALVISHGTNIRAGVAILFSQKLGVNIISTKEVCKGRVLMVRASINDRECVFVNVYAPNTGKDRVALFGGLAQELAGVAPEVVKVIGGDWNCTIEFTKDRSGEEPHLGSARALRDVVNKWDLIDTWRNKHPNTKQFSWVKVAGGRVSAARLDRIYVSH